MMSWLTILLRVLHVGGGVVWAGAAIAFAGFVEPTATAAGPEGGRFLQRLAAESGYSQAMSVAGLLTVVAGLWLFSLDSNGFRPEWMASGQGVMLSVGALTGLAAAVVGLGVQARNAMRLAAVVKAMQGRAGGPTPEQVGQVEALRMKLRNGGRLAALLLGITVVCMATARYVQF
jgi:uncharacterized membrane protein